MAWQGLLLMSLGLYGESESVCVIVREMSCTHTHCYIRPEYQEEPSPASEVIQEERSEVNLSHVEDQMEDTAPDSEDEAPVFLDLSGLKTGKDLEVWYPLLHYTCICPGWG